METRFGERAIARDVAPRPFLLYASSRCRVAEGKTAGLRPALQAVRYKFQILLGISGRRSRHRNNHRLRLRIHWMILRTRRSRNQCRR
jgi:hypothetical protein